MKQCSECGAPADESDRFCATCGAPLERESRPADPLIGRVIAGGYQIQELIGVGGMGRVYKGVQTMLGRTVALKVIHPHLLSDGQTVARFYNEARAASRLNHPQSVGIIDFGRTDDGMLYLVMEHLEGRDLATILAEEGPLPFRRITEILKPVLSALGEAHVLGVIHRDLKPENIIVQKARRGQEKVKVVDFGLATIVGPGSSSITTPGLVCGTPDYMSPEQGRGDLLDGRSDIYAVGVMLFEMLADRLPFVDDTPTKVVLKHIHEPVPDPRMIAPARLIPDVLATLTMKALAKNPDARFRTADEMEEALRKAELVIEAASQALMECSTCGHMNPMNMRFCGECGTRLTGVMSIPPPSKAAPQRSRSGPPESRPLIGRQRELAALAAAREAARAAPSWVRIVGEAGVGKTRLATEFARDALVSGDHVVFAGPHPSGTPIAYHTARVVIAKLFGVETSKLGELASSAAVNDPLVRAGLAEVAAPRGMAGEPGRSRGGAVVRAMVAAFRVAAARSGSGAVLVMIDDLSRCDQPSQDVFAAATAAAHDVRCLLITTSSNVREPANPAARTIVLRGLDVEDTKRFLSGTRESLRPPAPDPADASRLLTPLYLEQVRMLATSGWEDAPPPRLADAVMLRLERLTLPARRLLQAISVLGDSCSMEALRSLATPLEIEALERLESAGWVLDNDDHIEVTHPFVRELIEASIPASARKDLHAKALALSAQKGEPLEIRAEHAFKAGEVMSAVLLLERMGDTAALRGDSSAAILAYRRGLELARRELWVSGDDELDRVIVVFSRKLGEALEKAHDWAGADGVLRETLELAGPRDKERTRMLLVLGRVALAREKPRDAQRLFGQALEIARAAGDVRGEGECQLGLSHLRRSEGDLLAATNTMAAACELLAQAGASDAVRITALLDLAEALLELGDQEQAVRHVSTAEALAREVDAPALLARAIGSRGAGLKATGDLAGARERYSEAASAAAEAGDAEAEARWTSAAARVEAP